MCVLKMKLSVWCVVLYSVLYVGASGGEDKSHGYNSGYGSLGYGLELLLTKFDIISAKLQKMEDKIQSVEDKFKSMNDNLHSVKEKVESVEVKVQSGNEKLESVEDKLLSAEDKYQRVDNNVQIMSDSLLRLDDKLKTMNDNLRSVEETIQKTESKLLEITNDSQDHRSSQMIAAFLKLERQVALNLSEVHNRNQQNVQILLLELKRDIDDVHNITRQIKNALPQLRPTTEIPPKQERLTTTEESVSTTTTPKPKQPPYSSCKDVPWKVSGIYMIRVKSDSKPFEVYCEQEAHEGGWIVFQYRYDGSLDFYRSWNEYRDGFGELNKEFWLGLEKVHQITRGRKHELLVELKDIRGNYKYARYDAFEIESESDQYNLKEFGKYNGSAGDAMSYRYKGRKFSTKDRDNDESSLNCAQKYESAWWYRACTYANLNGRYKNVLDFKSMFWWVLENKVLALSYSRMMIRELK